MHHTVSPSFVYTCILENIVLPLGTVFLLVKFKSSTLFLVHLLKKKKLGLGGLPPSALELGLDMSIALMYIELKKESLQIA